MRFLIALAWLMLASLPLRAAEPLVIFAAASMKQGLDAVVAQYQAQSGQPVVVSYAGSNTLAKQILAGAPADLFFSAAPDWMAEVTAAGLVAQQVPLLSNRLVLIAGGGGAGTADVPEITADFPLAGRLGAGRLSMAMTRAVPAGQYGRAALEHLGLWQEVTGQMVESDNVRAALRLVLQGEAAMGIAYESDQVGLPDLAILGRFPEESHPPILYPLALLTEAKPGAEALYHALQGPEAKDTFEKFGFIILAR